MALFIKLDDQNKTFKKAPKLKWLKKIAHRNEPVLVYTSDLLNNCHQIRAGVWTYTATLF